MCDSVGFVGGVQDGVRALKIMLQTLDKPIQRIDSTVVAMYKIIEGEIPSSIAFAISLQSWYRSTAK